MKKIILVILSMFVLTSCLFADKFVVKNVVGSAKYETSNNKYVDIKVGQEFEGSVNFNIGLNSFVEIELVGSGEVRTIPARSKDEVAKLWVANFKLKGGLKKQQIAKADAVNVEGAREGVNTASSRASEAKEDFTWEE